MILITAENYEQNIHEGFWITITFKNSQITAAQSESIQISTNPKEISNEKMTFPS